MLCHSGVIAESGIVTPLTVLLTTPSFEAGPGEHLLAPCIFEHTDGASQLSRIRSCVVLSTPQCNLCTCEHLPDGAMHCSLVVHFCCFSKHARYIWPVGGLKNYLGVMLSKNCAAHNSAFVWCSLACLKSWSVQGPHRVGIRGACQEGRPGLGHQQAPAQMVQASPQSVAHG